MMNVITQQAHQGKTTPAASGTPEFSYTWEHFNYLRTLSRSHTGIVAPDSMFDLFYSRLSNCLRKRSLADFGAYCSLLTTARPDVVEEFINALTTNLTSFFREIHHFDYLHWTVLPDLVKRNADSKRIRVWSAGCSTGEEPYSLGIVLQEALRPQIRAGWDIKILATDIDSSVLEQSKKGLYTPDRIAGMPESYMKTGFPNNQPDTNGFVQIAPNVQSLIQFKKLNLMEAWPMTGVFDIIFCRNVMIYFDRKTKTELISRYADALGNDGHLFVGQAETVLHNREFELLANTTYKTV